MSAVTATMASTSSLPSSSTPTPTMQTTALPPPCKYRGATVEDLQLPPAFCLPVYEKVASAIEEAYERDFSQIPVLSKERRVLGYLDVKSLKEKWEAGEVDPQATVSSCMIRFDRQAHKPYKVITPYTPLQDLEEFLTKEVFALVTDPARKFVLGVATMSDVENFLTRRGQ